MMIDMVEYYDYVLGLIPIVLAGLSTGLYAIGIGFTIALVAGGASAIALVSHALFVRSPEIDREHQTSGGPSSAD